ncbi:Mu-like prophage major head subunit gpT family protein [Roseovarius dicentrarchi]|uniref:Mu-like prophage major head subunit gpT family protein n=1 Tax=Roseovarius dicentrarchi TaxID=2250573 RepID=UPI000DEA552B|nr:Mu-like prophage major head subunit gpT family protein [Roseovarius dicentrarchi]
MLINAQSLDLVYSGFKTVYTDAYLAAPTHSDKVAMTVPSSGRDETYGWIGQFPQLREWIGPRHVHGLSAHSFKIVNRDFESTVSVHRNDIMDDRLGVFKPSFAEMGHLARNHPEELIFGLLADGFESQCYDGQSFFDADHPQKDGKVSVSNMQTGTGAPWYLLDTSRSVRPLIWQEREGYQFQAKTSAGDDNVFMNNEFLYGVNARVNAGFGLWQLAFASKAELTPANYAAARAAMMNFRSDDGRILGINPTTLVVPPTLESAALHVVNTETSDGGGSNPWKGTAELIVTPFVV